MEEYIIVMSEKRESGREILIAQFDEVNKLMAGLIWYAIRFEMNKWDEETYSGFKSLTPVEYEVSMDTISEDELNAMLKSDQIALESMKQFLLSHGVDESVISNEKLKAYHQTDLRGELQAMQGAQTPNERLKRALDYFSGKTDEDKKAN